jgi:hypothetical protein
MGQRNRTLGNEFYGPNEVLSELDRLKFAVSSMAQLLEPGSYARENANNIVEGLGRRLDWLHDAVRIQAEKREAEAVNLQRTIDRLRANREVTPPTECVA